MDTSLTCCVCRVTKAAEGNFELSYQYGTDVSICEDCLEQARLFAQGLKWCFECDTVKTLGEFRRARGLPGGRSLKCRDCINKRDRERRARYREMFGPSFGRRPPRRGNFPPAVRKRLLGASGGCCQRCGSTKEVAVDHIVPAALGGEGVLGNGQVLCVDCHREKTYADLIAMGLAHPERT